MDALGRKRGLGPHAGEVTLVDRFRSLLPGGRGERVPRPGFGPFANRPVTAAAASLVLVYGLGATSVLFAPEGSQVAVWWPAAGVSVAMLVLAPARWRLPLALGVVLISGLANLTAGRTPEASAAFGVSNAAEALVVTWWLTRGRSGHTPLRTMEDLWRLLLATGLGNLVIGGGIGLTAEFLLLGDGLASARAVMASHAAAILVIVPLAMQHSVLLEPGRRREAALQWVLLVAAVGYVFSPSQVLSLTFLPVPLLIWAALRLGQRTVSAEMIVLGVLTATLTAQGWGPFAFGSLTGVTTAATSGSLVQAFLIATALIALSLAVAVAQRQAAAERLAEREELFRKSFSESFAGMLLLARSEDTLRVVELNDTAATILGGTTADFEGAAFEDLVEASVSLDEVTSALTGGFLEGWRDQARLPGAPGKVVGLAISALSTPGEPTYTAQMIDLTDVETAHQRLRTEKEFTAAVLNTTGCLVLVLDGDGVLVGTNPAAERASGFAEADVVDRPVWASLVPADQQETIQSLIAGARRTGRPVPREGDLATVSGRRRRIVWTAGALTDADERTTHTVLTGIDVTSERTVQSVVDHLLAAATTTIFIGTDLNGQITSFNNGAEAVLGWTAVDMVGVARLDALYDREELARAARDGQATGFAVLTAGVSDTPVTADWTYVHKDGSQILVAVTMSAVRDAYGQHIGYLAVGRDVTESRRSQQRLVDALEKEREAVERLQELDGAKDGFVSTVSHELRTPITSIVGYTEMLQDGIAGTLSPEQVRLVDAVRRNGERLISLIEDLLTLSRIEAGTFSIQRNTLDLRAVVSQAHEAVRPMLANRRLDVSVEVAEHPVPVLGDRDQLERVVINLLGNAVKFTEDGGRVRMRLEYDGGTARLEVADTGIGIPESEQAQLFSRFFRSSSAQHRQIQGTGLGLSIVQTIVQSHGGRIDVRSRPQVGTTVEVALPLSSSATLPSPAISLG